MEEKTQIPGIYRSAEGVLINKDNDALAAYKKRKQKEKKINTLEESFHHIRSDLLVIKEDINEIRELLRGLVR